MNTEVKTGLRPISKRAFKRGGKVAQSEGTKAHQHAGKKPRQHGGKALSADTLINRSVKEANKSREGADRHPVGALKKGGRIRKADGGMRSERTEYEKDRRDSVDQGMNYGSDSQHNDDSLRKAVRKYENTAKETGYSNLKAGGRTKKDQGGMTGDPRTAMMKQMQDSNRAGVPSGLIPSKGGSSSRLAKSAGLKRGGVADLDGLKRGGSAHPDIAEDRKLIKQMIKSDAMKRPKHATKGKVETLENTVPKSARKSQEYQEKNAPYTTFDSVPAGPHTLEHIGPKEGSPRLKSAPSNRDDDDDDNEPVWTKRGGKVKHGMRSHHAKGGKTGHSHDCECNMCWGGAAKAKGDRVARATGGKTGKGGKTNIHINIAPSGGSTPPAPIMPPRSIPVPPPQGGAGGPPQMGGGMPMPMPFPVPMGGGAGGPPPPPMGRKHGGRTSYPITTGSGGGNARIEKIDSYGATSPKRSLGR
jgi:hypothetical protein